MNRIWPARFAFTLYSESPMTRHSTGRQRIDGIPCEEVGRVERVRIERALGAGASPKRVLNAGPPARIVSANGHYGKSL